MKEIQRRLSANILAGMMAAGLMIIGCMPRQEEIQSDPQIGDIRLTEINYHPLDSAGTDGDSLEFIELKNVGSVAMSLSGVTFTSAIAYAFPFGSTLQPGAFCVLASNSSWFKTRYSFKPFGEYEGQLRNSEDTIIVKEIKSGVTLVTIAYSDQFPWSAYADGNGWSLATKNPNPSLSEQGNPGAWRHSLRLNGSPGRDDPEPVLVNEVLPHTDPPLTDAVELFNPSASPIDLGNWFISDDINYPVKFRIPAGTSIPAHGYVVFDEHDFNADPTLPTSFRLSKTPYRSAVTSRASILNSWRNLKHRSAPKTQARGSGRWSSRKSCITRRIL
jgi:hypothetical protein